MMEVHAGADEATATSVAAEKVVRWDDGGVRREPALTSGAIPVENIVGKGFKLNYLVSRLVDAA